jgi:DNA-binding NarL/FixJ family response regulator
MEKRAPDTTRPRVLIADDHLIFAKTLGDFLEKSFSVIGVVTDGRAMVDEVTKQRPDVVVSDIAMPLMNGLEAARRIRELVPDVKFVFLTMQDDPNLAAAALELGRVAFVLKLCDGPELLKALTLVLHGKSYVTPQLRPEDWVEARTRARQLSKELTSRQREIVQMLAEGRALKEIADILSLSFKTIQFHKQRVMRCFNLKNNADMVLFALKRGIISVDPKPQLPSKKKHGRS